jgi:hypothetical protein
LERANTMSGTTKFTRLTYDTSRDGNALGTEWTNPRQIASGYNRRQWATMKTVETQKDHVTQLAAAVLCTIGNFRGPSAWHLTPTTVTIKLGCG